MLTYTCARCGKPFRSHNPKPTYCSLACKAAAQTVAFDADRAIALYDSGMTQADVAAAMGLTPKIIQNLFKRRRKTARKAARRPFSLSGKHYWSGDDVTYSALHYRVESERGKPSLCSRCGKTKGRFEWANLTGNYTDINDYERLCRSCHHTFDNARRRATGISTSIHVKRRKEARGG